MAREILAMSHSHVPKLQSRGRVGQAGTQSSRLRELGKGRSLVDEDHVTMHQAGPVLKALGPISHGLTKDSHKLGHLLQLQHKGIFMPLTQDGTLRLTCRQV